MHAGPHNCIQLLSRFRQQMRLAKLSMKPVLKIVAGSRARTARGLSTFSRSVSTHTSSHYTLNVSFKRIWLISLGPASPHAESRPPKAKKNVSLTRVSGFRSFTSALRRSSHRFSESQRCRECMERLMGRVKVALKDAKLLIWLSTSCLRCGSSFLL